MQVASVLSGLAENMAGSHILRVTAVNCQEQADLCAEHGVEGSPSAIKVCLAPSLQQPVPPPLMPHSHQCDAASLACVWAAPDACHRDPFMHFVDKEMAASAAVTEPEKQAAVRDYALFAFCMQAVVPGGEKLAMHVGKVSGADLKKWALRQIPSHVSLIRSSTDLNKLLDACSVSQREGSARQGAEWAACALLVTDSKDISSLWKAMSARYRGKVRHLCH
jgi:hypothetical protein